MLNLYPNEGNFALPSFMSPVVPPDADPLDEPLFSTQFSAAWLPYVLGALDQLVLYASWDGDDDAKLLASMRAATLKEFIATAIPITVPTPYWDEDTEVDDQAESPVQTWYGSVDDPELPPDELTFTENALIWVMTGFVAAASWEVGFAPAILFHTIAPKFYLAMRRGAIGEVIRILIDGADAVTVDTSSASEGDVINVPIVADPAITTGHDIMLLQVS